MGKREKKSGKEGKNQEKEEKLERKGKNQKGSVTLPLLTERAGYATGRMYNFCTTQFLEMCDFLFFSLQFLPTTSNCMQLCLFVSYHW